jgi:hypothetical protein
VKLATQKRKRKSWAIYNPNIGLLPPVMEEGEILGEITQSRPKENVFLGNGEISSIEAQRGNDVCFSLYGLALSWSSRLLRSSASPTPEHKSSQMLISHRPHHNVLFFNCSLGRAMPRERGTKWNFVMPRFVSQNKHSIHPSHPRPGYALNTKGYKYTINKGKKRKGAKQSWRMRPNKCTVIAMLPLRPRFS